MRSFFRVINAFLFAVALLAAAFFGYAFRSFRSFPRAEFEAQILSLKNETEKTRTETEIAVKETAERLEYLQSDVRHNGEEAAAMADELDALYAQREEKILKSAQLQNELKISEDIRSSALGAREQYAMKIRELEEQILRGESEIRICYWTLDDGPSYITKDFLDALDAMGEHVHVTFFTSNGANDAPGEEELLRREILSGHSVQNHTFTHDYWEGGRVYSSLEGFKEQVLLQDEWLYQVTGFRPGIFRFPGGSAWGSDLVPGAKDAIAELGYEWADWNCNLYDSGSNLPKASVEISRAMTQVPEEKIAVVLGHDWNPQTLIAMKTAIPALQEQGYVFLPLFEESVMMGQAATR